MNTPLAGHGVPSWWQTGHSRRVARRSQRAWVRALVSCQPQVGTGRDPDAAQQVQGRLGMLGGSGRVMGASEGPPSCGARGRDG